jgi:hypothetical protein
LQLRSSRTYAAGIRNQAPTKSSTEIISGRANFQQRLTATCKTLCSTEILRGIVRTYCQIHEPILAMKVGEVPSAGKKALANCGHRKKTLSKHRTGVRVSTSWCVELMFKPYNQETNAGERLSFGLCGEVHRGKTDRVNV